MADKANLKQTKEQALFVEWVIDVLSYTVILNIFVHFVDGFYIENFMLSLVTAVLMKVILVIVTGFEHQVKDWLEKQKATIFRILTPVILMSILFFSKLLMLEVIDFIFGPRVDLHNFIALIFMIITMIATRKIIYKIYRLLG